MGFSIWPGRANHSPIGIDVGERCIKAAQFVTAGRRRTLERATIFPRTPGTLASKDVELIGDTLQRQGFVGNHVVLTAPRSMVLSGMIEIPSNSRMPAEHVARSEVARMHRVEPATIQVSWWDLPAARGHNRAGKPENTSAMAVACPCADADSLLDLFEDAGFNVLALDVDAAAVTRACSPLIPRPGAGDSGISLILDLGWSSTRLIMLHVEEKPVVVYERTIQDSGVDQLIAALARNGKIEPQLAELVLGVSRTAAGEAGAPSQDDASVPGVLRTTIANHFEQAIKEIMIAVGYIAHRYAREDAQTVDRVLLVGGGGAIVGIEAFMQEQIGVPTKVVTAGALTTCSHGAAALETSPALVTAIGLADYSEASA